ncbi:MAG: inositol monophosphatase [Simkaniaceae bacterium]|nr:inositol monophosphatase [Simkaniaceae bacterium]MCF7851721.1 inositol monophosphatase [Simkaniaceae bacterium]
MKDIYPDQLRDFAVELALDAGKILREGFGTTFAIEAKDGKHDIVTEYDYKSERFLLDAIAKKHPEHLCVSEESGGDILGKDKVLWVIDPLDGTVNFSRNIPFFSVSIAAIFNQTPLCGVVYNPEIDELFYASREGGAFFGDHQISVSPADNIKKAMFATGFPYNVEENPFHCYEHLTHILSLGVPIRRMGSAALDICYVANGRYDGFWEVILNPWDYAAGALILEEAGGKTTEIDGTPLTYTKRCSIAASNGSLHTSLLDHLAVIH